MLQHRFNEILDERLNRTRELLAEKANQYALTDDRLSNFKRVAQSLGETPKQTLFGYVSKHWDALLEYARIEAATEIRIPRSEWIAKLEDVVGYMILLEALCHDDYHEPNATFLGADNKGRKVPLSPCQN